MTAKIIQLRDFKRKEEKPVRLVSQNDAPEMIPYHGAGIDGMNPQWNGTGVYRAKDQDPA